MDDALLEIGRYHLEVEGDAARRARPSSRSPSAIPQSDGAPGAYYYLGLLTLDRATTAAELDDALAQFARVQRLYPRSEWVPRALYATGLAHRKAGRLRRGGRRRRAASPSSTRPATPPPAAQFEIGHALALAGRAAPGHGGVPAGPQPLPGQRVGARRALDRITALYRLYGAGKPAFALDPAYAVGAGDVLKDVRAILMTPGAHALDRLGQGRRARSPSTPDGKMGAGLAGEDLRSLSPRRRAASCVVAAQLAVRVGPKDIKTFAIPGDKPGEHGAARQASRRRCVTPGGAVLVADEKQQAGLPLRRAGTSTRARSPTPRSARSRRMVARRRRRHRAARPRREDGAASSTRRASVLRTLAPAGRATSCGSRWTWPSTPSATSTWPTRRAGVLVFSPAGPAPGHDRGARSCASRAALTLDPSGAVLVYDEQAAADPELSDEARHVPSPEPLRSLAVRAGRRAAARARSARRAARRRAPRTPAQTRAAGRAGPAGPRHRRVRRARSRAARSCSSTRSSTRLEVPAPRRARCPPRGREILAQAYELRGRAYYNIGLQEKAADSFRSLVQLQPAVRAQQGEGLAEGRRLLQLGEEGAGGYLAVSSKPAGRARSRLNGEFLSLTDFFPLEVLAGEYTVEIAREGYRTETRTVSIAPKATETLAGRAHAHAGQRLLRHRAGGGGGLGRRRSCAPPPAARLAPELLRGACARKGLDPARASARIEIAQPLAGHATSLELRRKCYETGEAHARDRRRPRDYDAEPVQAGGLAGLAPAHAPTRRARASSSTARPWASRPQDSTASARASTASRSSTPPGKFIQDLVLGQGRER